LNPKATLFFLSLFTVVINPHTPWRSGRLWGVPGGGTALWFCLVAMLFSQQRVRAGLRGWGIGSIGPWGGADRDGVKLRFQHEQRLFKRRC
jgi:threonine/homoserine/homoserine lactone efflux protein